jgi:hypothetical protein
MSTHSTTTSAPLWGYRLQKFEHTYDLTPKDLVAIEMAFRARRAEAEGCLTACAQMGCVEAIAYWRQVLDQLTELQTIFGA